MKHRFAAIALTMVTTLLVAACSSPAPSLTWSGSGSITRADAPDAGGDGAASPGSSVAASDTIDPVYPAPHGPMPLVDYNGGAIVASPRIVTITVAGDPMHTDLQEFGDIATKTAWWTRVSEGYCVEPAGTPCIGPGESGGHVVLPALSKTMYKDAVDPTESSSIKDLLRARIHNGSMPAPTSSSIYVLYLPPGVDVSLELYRSCVPGGFYGFHNAMSLDPKDPSSQRVYYAVIARCSGSEAQTTRTASHEIIEAATDPDIGGTIGFYMNDPLWAFEGGEVGDVCVDLTGNENDTIVEQGFTFQRSWSNKAAAAGHDPCVPAPASKVYFNAAPKAGSESIALAVGESRTIEVDAFSDAPTSNWSLDVIDAAALAGQPPYLSAQTSVGSVNNGSKIALTLTLLQPLEYGGSVPYILVSRSHGTLHTWMAEVTQRR